MGQLNIEGRVHDGWILAVDLKDRGTVRLADFDSPEAVWARVRQARKTPGAEVIFSGCKETPESKLDGWGAFLAEDVQSVRNFGPSVAGAGAVDARVAKLENQVDEVRAALAAHATAIEEIEADMDEDEVPEGGEPGPEGTVTPIPLPTEAASPEALQAMAGASDEQ